MTKHSSFRTSALGSYSGGRITYNSFIAYIFKGQVQMFAGRVKIVSHSSCRTSAMLICFCPLILSKTSQVSMYKQYILTSSPKGKNPKHTANVQYQKSDLHFIKFFLISHIADILLQIKMIMHQSLITTSPRRGMGIFMYTLPPSVLGKFKFHGFDIGKYGAAVQYKTYQTAGTTAMVLPACCHHSVIRAGAWL